MSGVEWAFDRGIDQENLEHYALVLEAFDAGLEVGLELGGADTVERTNDGGATAL